MAEPPSEGFSPSTVAIRLLSGGVMVVTWTLAESTATGIGRVSREHRSGTGTVDVAAGDHWTLVAAAAAGARDCARTSSFWRGRRTRLRNPSTPRGTRAFTASVALSTAVVIGQRR